MERELRRMFRESELFYDAMFCGKMMIGKLDKDVRAKTNFTAQRFISTTMLSRSRL